jgi:hypothetical protein
MAFFDMFDKLDDIIYEPIKLITDWAREPLKTREHNRNLEKETNIANTNAKIEREKLELESNLRNNELELQANLKIKKETEVHRIISEINELQKDKDFQRMKLVSESIMRYQQQLTTLNVNAINAIGTMQLELREKAQDLVYNKTIKYKELQDKAIYEAGEDLEKILEKFPDNERMQDILIKAVDKRLSNVIDTAQNFLLELNEDIKLLNKSINSLAEGGQKFIEKHLDSFHQLSNNSPQQLLERKEDIIDV